MANVTEDEFDISFPADKFPLDLDASPIEQLRSLTTWHVDFARGNPKTFFELTNLLSSLGVKYEARQVNSRMFKFAQESLSKSQKLRLLNQLQTLAFLPQFTPYGETVSTQPEIKKTPEPLRDAWGELDQIQKQSLLEHGDLKTLLEHSIEQIKSPRNQIILKMRLGLPPYEVHTLQETGDVAGITRERVRQLVKKELQRLERTCLWDDVFREEVQRLFEKWGPLLPANHLSDLSGWFEGFKLSPKSWEVFTEFFASDTAVLRASDGAWLTPRVHLENIERVIKEYTDLRAEGASKVQIQNSLINLEYLNIQSVAFFEDQISTIAPTTRITDTTLVKSFLNETDNTFGLDDFFHFCMRRDHIIDADKSSYIINRFADFAAPISRTPTKYISRGGLNNYCPDPEMYIEKLLEHWHSHFDDDRIFHGDEIRDWAITEGLDFCGDWGSWWAVAPLKLDDERRFTINKLVVGMRATWEGQDIPTRKELIEELLRRQARPMKAREIVTALKPKIGFGDIFQIYDEGRIRALGNGFFDYRGD